jgi:hypothetical protein
MHPNYHLLDHRKTILMEICPHPSNGKDFFGLGICALENSMQPWGLHYWDFIPTLITWILCMPTLTK